MRLWSIHPKHLDSRGLVALWREGLLAQKVLDGKTRGYRHHPQLFRFRRAKDPLSAIGSYLDQVAKEAQQRGYRFDRSKILRIPRRPTRMTVTQGQLKYESKHLLTKLKRRDPVLYKKCPKNRALSPHPIFRAVRGPIQSWEIVTDTRREGTSRARRIRRESRGS